MWHQIDCSNSKREISLDRSKYYDETCDFCKNSQCWETYIGAAIYRLVISNIVSGIFIQILFFEIFGNLVKNKLEFLRPIYNVTFVENRLLNIVYFQIIIWSGYFYCPALLPIGFGYLLISYWIMSWSDLNNFNHDQVRLSKLEKNSRAYKIEKRENVRRIKALLMYDNDYFFYYTLSVGFFVAFITVLFTVVSLKASYWCSPFQFGRILHSTDNSDNAIVDTVKFYSSNFVVNYWQHSHWNYLLTVVLIYIWWFLRGLTGKRKGTIDLIKNQQKFQKME